jgi:hypothetical protein
MQKISEFKDNLGTAILLTGGAGAGKTTLGMRLFPRTYVFVADLNFKSGLDYCKKIGCLENIVGFDTASPDESGKIVPANSRYQRMLDKIKSAIDSPEVDCIMLDSATFIEDVIKARICNASTDAAIKLSGYDQWGLLILTWKSLVMQMRQSGKKLIMTAHEQKEQDESDSIYKYQIAVDGQIRGKFPILFSDVWRCEVQEQNGTHTWNVRCLGNVRQEYLKNTYGFPGVLKADDLVKQVQAKAS